MNEDPSHVAAVERAASVHSALTALSVSVGRLDERLTAIKAELNAHMSNEHKSFDQAMDDVAEIKSEVATLRALAEQAKGAGLLANLLSHGMGYLLAAGAGAVAVAIALSEKTG